MNALLLMLALAADPVSLFAPQSAKTVQGSSMQDGGTVTVTDDGTIEVVSKRGDVKTPWLTQAIIRTTGPIAEGDVLLLTMPIELKSTGDDALNPGTGLVRVNLTKEPTDGDNQFGLKYDQVSFSGEMKPYYTQIIAETDVAAGDGRLALHFSPQAQSFTVGEITLKNYGPDFPLDQLPRNDLGYQGREPGAAWRAEAAKRIRRHRTGPLSVRVVDEEGDAVPDAYVHFKLVNHEFGFGSAVQFPLLGATEEEFPLSFWGKAEWSWDDAQKYREVVERDFNKIVFEAACRPNVWPELHNPAVAQWKEQSRKHQLQLMRAFSFLDENNIAARGHYISWGAIDHPPQTEFVGKPKEHWAYQTRIAKEHPIQVGSRVAEWDVLNHPCGWGITMEELHGGLQLHAETMRIVREHAPKDTVLYVNEGHVLHERSQIGNYERIIKYLIDEGVGPDGIGFMSHFTDNTLTGMDDAYAVFERFAPLADHLQLTELDISSAQDPQLHADYLRDIMTLAFSHPKMAGVVQWGFWENAHWKPETSLYKADWTPKPAAKEWTRLVNDEWHTYEQGRTDADGRFAAESCYHGDYEVFAETDDLKSWQIVKSATRQGDELIITLKASSDGE